MMETKMLDIHEIINEKARVRDLVNDFHADLDTQGWPKVFFVADGKTFQDLVVALRVTADWHFEEGNDGFSFFVVGPTMVRVDNQGQPASARTNLLTANQKFVKEWKKNTSVDPAFRDKIAEMVQDGDLKVMEVKHEGIESETTA